MEILILGKLTEHTKKLSYLLLNLGITTLHAQSKNEALQKFEENPELNLGIIDIDNKEAAGMEFLQNVSARGDRNFRFIIHSALSMENLPGDIMEKSVIGHIMKPFEENRVNSSLKNIFSSINFPELDKRAHIRVFIDQEDLLRINLKLRNYRPVICGKILNLSLGGAAIEILGPFHKDLFREGILIPKINFSINCKNIDTSGTVVLLRGKVLAIRFGKFTPEARNAVAKFILTKISPVTDQKDKLNE